MAAADNGLADIIAPAAPPASEWGLTLVALLAMTLALLLAWYWLRSPRARARRRLKRLQRAVRTGRLSPRQAAYRTAAELRTGLGLPHPGVATASATGVRHDRQQRWARYVDTLAAQRYAPADPERSAVLRSIREARRWLRPWS